MTLAPSTSRLTAPPTSPPAPARAASRRVTRGVSHVFLISWAAVVGIPLVWALMTSFKTDAEIFSSPWALPAALNLDNYVRAWTTAQIGSYFINTLIVVGGALVLTMLLGSMTAYVLARFDFPGNRLLFYLFIAGMMFPVFLALVPLFFVVRDLGMLNTHHGLILVYTAYALPFTVFFLTSFFRTLPTAIAEAALIDGASQFGVFFRVMLPMARPGIISIGIFNFLGLWNQYLLPLVLVSDQDKYVLTQGLAALSVSQGYAADYSALFAGLMIAMFPLLAVYLIFQNRIHVGMTVGALK
ncbi:carbohydrate ABC transporter permease [Phytoactinopolyspora mesophila]|uniref:ABC transporter permease subunit n=1 Tax=Phytoactinopolyspora mesophila TaxID=2650750 RepID=A0A7K3M0M5_9ACTN|nr:carbohydrate ABC transporter permease [Phytoactinopolyspora mesophila]NDL56829.1 ABC transporter permease subunit [Phytoactinopolyspora mesophila]